MTLPVPTCAGGIAGSQVTVEGLESASAPADDLLLFTTQTCPNCRQAERLLQQAGLPYQKVLAEEHPELTTRYGVRQAPTLVAITGGEAVKAVGLGPVKKFIEDNRPAEVG